MSYFTKNDQGEYVEVTDKLYTETEYKAVKDKNNELRATNTNLLKTNESLSAFADILDGAQNITPDGLMKKINEKATEKAASMVTDMKAKHESDFAELTKKYESATSTLHNLMLGDAVRKVGPKHGVLDTAYDDVLRRADAAFKVEDGKVVFKGSSLDANGQAYTVDSWLAETIKTAPHLAQAPKGPGARQNSTFRSGSVNSGEKRSGMDLIAAGLSKSSTKGIN